MALVRKNVYELGGDWADPILWYARAVGELKKRPLAATHSWRFYGAMHGFRQSGWKLVGYYRTTDKLPAKQVRRTYWEQCQHGSWYFLPWHRGYLMAFEGLIRDEVVKLGGPPDWTLPYWNYFKSGQANLPPAFASRHWPDGQANNPLFERHRYGPNGDGKVFIQLNQVNLNAMHESNFVGLTSGASIGFGGPDTGFEHGGPNHGGIEAQPHDWVHVLVGGQSPDQRFPGLMSDPTIAGLDPIFWLHHANIDRLWEAWSRSEPTHRTPTTSRWIQGPAASGERAFAMPKADGTVWNYTPGDMRDLATLRYSYDDLEPGVSAASAAERLTRLGLIQREGTVEMASRKKVELVGASQKSVKVRGDQIDTMVTLDSKMRQKVVKSLTRVEDKAPTPDRIFLKLENVRGKMDSTAFHVYVGVPLGTSHDAHPNRLAGSIGLFGVSEASDPKGKYGGQGLTYTLDITDIVDELYLDNAFDAESLAVRLVPLRSVDEKAKVSVGRMSVYRQGQ